MNTNISDHRSSDGTTPTNPQLLRNPIDFIAEDHLRLRMICADMDRLAEAETLDRESVEALTEYLEKELPLLLEDEDDGLLPRVLSRAEPEDDLPKLLARLQQDHARIALRMQVVMGELAGIGPSHAIGARLSEALRSLASATRRHLILENAVLLPLARARLTNADLDEMRKAMLKRRGLDDLFAA